MAEQAPAKERVRRASRDLEQVCRESRGRPHRPHATSAPATRVAPLVHRLYPYAALLAGLQICIDGFLKDPQIQSSFDRADADGSGYIDTDKLQTALSGAGRKATDKVRLNAPHVRAL